jgi:hypothetical protein
MEAMYIVRVNDQGQIAEHWGVGTIATMAQLGLLPSQVTWVLLSGSYHRCYPCVAAQACDCAAARQTHRSPGQSQRRVIGPGGERDVLSM